MLHLGTKKYPEEQAYKEFLRKHGGASNAATGPEYTFYFFDVKAEHLDPALDRFSQLFTSPLFTEPATEREINAVHNEYTSGVQIDSRRHFYLHKSLVNRGHPFGGFQCGNLDTLKQISRSELIDFHKQNYASSLMKLAVVGREPVDELEQMVTARFSDIADRDGARAERFADFPFSEITGNVVRVVPVRDLRNIEVCWPVPAVYDKWRQKITAGITHCLGHEGPGSLLSHLKSKGWANALGVSPRHSGYTFVTLVSTVVTLTPEGLANWEKVLASVYSYLDVLRQCSDEDWARIYDEEAKLSGINFRFAAKMPARRYAQHLSSQLRRYGAEHVIQGPYLYDQYDVAKTKDYLALLTPKNSFVYLTSKTFADEADKVEKWYNVHHRVDPLPAELQQSCGAAPAEPSLKVPAENPFIPSNFDILSRQAGSEKKDADGYPTLIRSEALPNSMQCWHKLDHTFERPKAIIRTKIHLAECSDSPRSAALTSLFVILLRDALDESTYDASLAGIHYGISSFHGGISLEFSGYNEKLAVLVRHVLERLVSFSTTASEQRFEAMREGFVRSLENARICRPIDQSRRSNSRFLSSESYSETQKLPHARAATWRQVVDHSRALFEQAKLGTQTLIHGNIADEEALSICKSIADTLSLSERGLPAEAWPQNQTLEIPFFDELSTIETAAGPKPTAGTDANGTPSSNGGESTDSGAAANNTAAAADEASNESESDGGPLEERFSLQFYAESFNSTEPNSALCNYYQLGPNSLDLRCVALVFSHIAKLPVFDQLRTKEQLAYIVWSLPTSKHGVLGFEVIIQSSNRTPDELDARVERFLSTYRARLDEVTDEEFRSFVDAVLTIRTEKPKNLSQEFDKHWSEISSRRYDFSILDAEVARLKRVTKAEVADFFDEYIAPRGAKRRKLSSKIFGHAEATSCKDDKLKSVLSQFTNAPHLAAANGDTDSNEEAPESALQGVLFQGSCRGGAEQPLLSTRRALQRYDAVCEGKSF